MEAQEQPAGQYDVIVVGGGINGTGIARDAALRGLRTLLLEKDDFSASTSAWNSRMVHGGIKYLEHGEIGLVRESLREREWLLRAAPHLVRPLAFMMPFLRRNRRGPLILRAGMLAYDVLSLDKSLPHHRILSRDESLRLVPGIDPAEIRGAALFYDAQAEFAERLSVENALAARGRGADVFPRRSVESLVVEDGRVTGVRWVDAVTGQDGTTSGRLVVNASGPWVDRVLASLGHGQQRRIGGTKGTHLVVDPFLGAPRCAMYYEAAADGRPVLVIPWRGRYLIGSTDIRYEGDPGDVRADDAELEYILGETNRLMPQAQLTRNSIRLVYTGVRPLPYEPDVAEAKVTRSHIVVDHAPETEGLVSIVGGKLTTFRRLAEDAVDVVERKLGRRRTRCRTRVDSLPGGGIRDISVFEKTFAAESGLPAPVARRLVSIYGARARLVAGIAAARPELSAPLREDSGMIGAEVVMATRFEEARTLQDIVFRRAMLGLDSAVDDGLCAAIGSIAASHEGWSDARIERDLAACRAEADRLSPAGGIQMGAVA